MSPVSASFRPVAPRRAPARRHEAAVRGRHGCARLERAALRSEGNAQRVCCGDVETPRPLVLDDRVTECVAPVADTERPHCIPVACAKHGVLRELDDGYLVAQAAEDARQRAQQIVEAPWAVEGQRQLAAAESERLQHSGQAEEVVGVEVRQKDLAELDQADDRSAEAAAACPRRSRRAASPTPAHERGGRSAASGRHRAGSAEEDDVEIHAASLGGTVCSTAGRGLARAPAPFPRARSAPGSPQTPSRGSEYPPRRDRPEGVLRPHDVPALRP